MTALLSLSRDGRPFTGAWIETSCLRNGLRRVMVAPSQGRGLKPSSRGETISLMRRPFTGAWIETTRREVAGLLGVVAPSQGRGLKQ